MQTISADGLTVFSEWAHLYYVTLGNLAYCAPGSTADSCFGYYDVSNVRHAATTQQPGWGLTNTAGFRNLQDWAYWSGLPYAQYSRGGAWSFDTYDGLQDFDPQTYHFYALAVRPGDVTVAAAAVPEPMTLPLVLTALGGLAVVRRQRRRAGSLPPQPASTQRLR